MQQDGQHEDMFHIIKTHNFLQPMDYHTVLRILVNATEFCNAEKWLREVEYCGILINLCKIIDAGELIHRADAACI